MSASRATQTAFIFYLGNPLGTASGPYSSSCFLFRPFFPFLPFFQPRYSGFVVSIPFSRLWGPCAFAHSPFCWNQYQFDHPLLGLIVVRFRIHILLLFLIPANFLLHRRLLHAQCSGFFTSTPSWKARGEIFHISSYLSLSSLAGMYTPRHSVLKGDVAISMYCSHGTESPRL